MPQWKSVNGTWRPVNAAAREEAERQQVNQAQAEATDEARELEASLTTPQPVGAQTQTPVPTTGATTRSDRAPTARPTRDRAHV